MKLRLHFDENVRGELWTDGNGVVQTDPPLLRETFGTTMVTSWAEHDPGRVITIDEGELWLHGMLWMSRRRGHATAAARPPRTRHSMAVSFR
jgi:hypothetical protein